VAETRRRSEVQDEAAEGRRREDAGSDFPAIHHNRGAGGEVVLASAELYLPGTGT
jgi:hypothetical protein